MLHLHLHLPLPHHQRPSSTITISTSTTKSCPLMVRTLSTVLQVHVPRTNRIGSVRCMANQRRVKMVAKQIRREISDMILTDKVLQFAVLPEAALGADRYLSSLTTISDVEVSSDLQVIFFWYRLLCLFYSFLFRDNEVIEFRISNFIRLNFTE